MQKIILYIAVCVALSQSVNAATNDAAVSVETAVTRQPNIVLFLVDDFGQRDLSCYGSSLYETPHMDQLAAEGVRFTNAYSAYARCVSSRTGLLSGKYPCRVEYAVRNDKLNKDKPKHHLPLSEVTFGEALKEHGYQTCYIGKWHLGKKGGGPGEQGFDTVIHSGSAGATGSYFFPFDVEKGNYVDNPVDGKEGDYLNDRLTDKAIEYVKQNGEKREKPFLLVVAHYAVHTPFEAPDELVQKYRKKMRKAGIEVGGKRDDPDLVKDRQGFSKTVQNNPTYAGMVENTDTNFGRLMAAIKEAGVGDDTAIIVTSDHGGLATRGNANRRPLATTNAPFRQGKGSIFEGGTRVPFIVKWPTATAAAGAVSEVQVIGTDVYPTMLEIAGAAARPEQHIDGVSCVRALKGQSYDRPPMFWYKWMARPDSTGDTRALALIDGPYKLVSWIDEDLTELFHLENDPGEKNNLADQEPDRVKRMLAEVERLENEVGNQRAAGQRMLERRIQKSQKKKRKKKE